MSEVLNLNKVKPRFSSTSFINSFGIDTKESYVGYIPNVITASVRTNFLNTSSDNVLLSFLSSELIDNLARLNSFKNLKKGWNGYDAEPLSEKLINRVISIVRILPIQPEIFPTGRESIQLEYHNGENYLEFEIYEDSIDAFKIVDGVETEEADINSLDVLRIIEDFNVNS